MTTFNDWWAAYDPGDANTAADRNFAEQAWDAASDAWLARVRELEAAVAELMRIIQTAAASSATRVEVVRRARP